MLPSWYPTPTAPVAGIFFREQAQALRRAGVRVGVVYPDMRSARTLRRGDWSANRFQITHADEDGIPTLRFNGWALPKLPRWSSALWIRQMVLLAEHYIPRHGTPQIVQAQGACWAGTAARAIWKKWGIPYVLTEHSSAYAHGTIRGWRRPYVVATLRDAALLMAVSPTLAAAMRPFAADRPIEILPNPVDTSFFTLPPQPRSAPPFRFLTVAVLRPKKGVEVVLNAFADAFRGRRDIVLEVGGDGPQRTELQGLAKELGVAEQVRFLGLLERAGVREAMWRAHAYVLASPKETFGIALLEAMATGLPVISTRSGGPDDLVLPGLGWLVPPARPDAVAEAMVACFIEGPRAVEREQASHHYVAERFSPEHFCRQLLSIHREVIAGDSKGGRIAEPARRSVA